MRRNKENRENRKINRNWKKKSICLVAILLIAFVLCSRTVFGASDDAIRKVLKENADLFNNNNIFASALRSIGWMFIKLLTSLATSAADLFETAFGFVDFTQYKPVQKFIISFKQVFIALVCLSLVFLGIILIFMHEKKPKIVINICIAVLVVSSSTYLIQQMNNLLSADVRSAIVENGSSENASSSIVYQIVGSSMYDLLYLDKTVGLINLTKDNRTVIDNLKEEDIEVIDINQIVKPDDVQGDSKDLVKKLIYYSDDVETLSDVNDGVAWTDFLNTYYYRFTVNWLQCILGLLSVIIVYICLAYKVVRILYEIVIHQLLAYLYSANLSDSQKIVKILGSMKDSYITLLLVLICTRVYSLAYAFINTMNVGGLTRAFLLVFVALAVIDGPNIIQKITGIDAGMTDGAHKMIAGMQVFNAGTRVAGYIGKGAEKIAETAGNVLSNMGSEEAKGNADLAEALDQDTKNVGGDAMPDKAAENIGTVGETGPDTEHLDAGIGPEGESGKATDQLSADNENATATMTAGEVTQPEGIENPPEDLGADQEMIPGGTGTEENNMSVIPEGSGFVEDTIAEEDGTSEISEAISDPMMPGSNIDPITGEPTGNADLERMEDEILQSGEPLDSGLGESEPLEYHGELFGTERPRMDGAKHSRDQIENPNRPGNDTVLHKDLIDKSNLEEM